MARIRTIKPDFFRHEKLYEAEKASGLPLRIAFAGLWTAADREGRFRWQPRALKLDCLPYDEVDFELVLNELWKAGFIIKYQAGDDGSEYGAIPAWNKHQHVNQREAASTIPAPTGASTCTHIPARGEGKGRERKGKEHMGVADATGGNIVQIDSAGYVFEGNIIRLKAPQLERWRKAYPNIPNITAALETADAYYSDRPPKDGKWFFAASSWLQRENDKYQRNTQQAEKEQARLRGDAW